MGEKRKLQAEIERCLKKVTEGVELFDDIFDKFYAAPQQNQKEKFEADLKKEIKKLQRLRDQIKGWLSSNEIKDKQSLQDTRKLIETQMERFKAVERETKTKAFSKSGLTAEQKLDPKEKEREEIRVWLQDSIDRLNRQNDEYECEIESLEACAGKKKKLEKEKQEKVEECRKHLERHKFHIDRLELLLRLLDNTTIDPAQIRDIKDDVEYYIDNCTEPDFEENEFIYDGFNLDLTELNQQLGNVAALTTEELEAGTSETATTASTTSTAPSPGPLRELSGSKEPDEKSRHASGEDAIKLIKPQASRMQSISRSTPTTPFKQSSVEAATPPVISSSIPTQLPPITTPPPIVPNVPYNSVAAGNRNNTAPTVIKAAAVSTPQPAQVPTPPIQQQQQQPPQQQVQTSSQMLKLLEANTEAPSVMQATKQTSATPVPSAATAALPQQQPPRAESTPPTIVPAAEPKMPVLPQLQQSLSALCIEPAAKIENRSSKSLFEATSVASALTSSLFPQQVQQQASLQQQTQQKPSTPLGFPGANAFAISSAGSVSVPQPALHPSLTSIANAIADQQQARAAQQQQSAAAAGAQFLSQLQQQHQASSNSSNAVNSGNALHSLLSAQLQASGASQQQQAQQQFQLQQAQNIPIAVSANHVAASVGLTQPQHQAMLLTSTATAPSVMNGPLVNDTASKSLTDNVDSLSRMAREALPSAGGGGFGSSAFAALLGSAAQSGSAFNFGSLAGLLPQPGQTQDAKVPYQLGASPLGKIQLGQSENLAVTFLDYASAHLPQPTDSERLKFYLPRAPCPTPVYYPQVPPAFYDSLDYFQRLSPETLFFTFYYMEGTRAQYLAATALKKQSWRFHTKYKMWFQRHEEPKTITDDFEQGTYIYFDFERWAQRRKEGFTFEYRYLEDKEL